MAHLISHFSLGLASLKVFDFTRLTPKALLYCRACFSAILQACGSDDLLKAVFTRVGKGTDSTLVRDGVSFFLNKYMKAHIMTTYAADKQRRRTLRQRLKVARRALDGVVVQEADADMMM